MTEITKAGGYPADTSNPDDWAAFLSRYLDNRATNAVHNGIGLVALHIVEGIREARASDQPRTTEGCNWLTVDERLAALESARQACIAVSKLARDAAEKCDDPASQCQELAAAISAMNCVAAIRQLMEQEAAHG